jgi:hypothetical protein
MAFIHPHPCHQENLKVALRKPTPPSRIDDDGTQKIASLSTRIFDGFTQGTSSITLRIECGTQETVSLSTRKFVVFTHELSPLS